jgi:signal transduction histidine kinase
VAHIQGNRAGKSTPSSRRAGRQQSIKRRVVRLVLIPSVVAVALWLVASGYLVFQGFYNRAVANSVRQVSIPAVPALVSIQQERRLSVAYLAQPSNDLKELLDQRQQTDRRLSELRTAATSALGNAPDSIVSKWNALTKYLDQLANARSTVDSRSVGGQKTYEFYNELLNAATDLFDTQARVVPNVEASLGGLAAVETFRASDLMSRAGSAIDSAFGSGTLGGPEHLQFVNLVGAYHFGLTNIAPHLEPDVRRRYEALTAGDLWKALVAAENAIISSGAWTKGAPRGLPVDKVRWAELTAQVSDQLVALSVTQADEVSAANLRTGNNQLLTASIGSLVALSIAIAAILWAVRQSGVLVDRALSVRLARLGEDAATVVDERLPAMMARLRRREQVNVSAELSMRDYGSDEIGQVAEVINRSLQAAAAAAVDEAKTRAAGTAMLMGVARRPQRPLQHGLKVVEDLQNRIGDEKLLTQLFDINHQLTQTRRFLENLVILAGGQIGRRFQNPVPLRRVLLAAFAEAQHYKRITLRSASDVALIGQSVAGTVHLLAELLDNALAFSPPGTTVWVTCSEVKHGVAIEIEDAGVGMTPEAVERANTLLATAPTPDVTELKDGSQVGLHVVAELAKRDGIQVSLRRSAYGGLLAIVLLPERVLAPASAGTDPDRTTPVRPLATVTAAAGTATAPAPVPTAPTVEARLVPPPELRVMPESEQRVGPVLEPRVTPAVPVQADTTPQPAAPPDTAGLPAESLIPHPVGTVSPRPRVAARPPLPHRQPQQHLVPELRDDSEGEAPDDATPARTPEESRNRFAQYQRGWADGRKASQDEAITRADQGGKA